MTKRSRQESTSKTTAWLRPAVAGFCLLAISTGPLSAVELYKYVNAEGNFEVSSAIPATLAARGYTVVNAQGQILRVIAPQLTNVERQEKAEQEKLFDEKLAVIKWEDELMLRYSSPADVEYARDQKTRALDTIIASTMLNIDRLKIKKQQLESQAANMERAGQALTPKILRNLDIVEEQIQGRTEEIAARQVEQKATLQEFERIILKVRELYGIPDPAFVEESMKMDLSKIDH